MAKYTIELRSLIENNYDLGLKDYPIFDESYRDHLNRKILNHYKFYEIGFETEALFKHYLNTKMDEIMPFYNQLYMSEKLKFNPFDNVNMTEIMDRDTSSKTLNSQFSTSENAHQNANENNTNQHNSHIDDINKDSIDVHSDTPQDLLNFKEMGEDKFASEASRNDSHSSTQSIDEAQSNSKNTSQSVDKSIGSFGGAQNDEKNENYILKTNGKTAGESFSEMLIKYRETFLNIDLMVIKELIDLFMLVF